MLKNNKIWLILTSVSIIAVILSSLQSTNLPIKVSVYLGILFLCLTLIPNNLALILPTNLKKWPQFIAKYKRDFGISAGLLFLTHSFTAWSYYGKFDFSFFFEGEIILGYLANVIFVLLLLTSSQWSKKVMKQNWKRLHILVWAAVPLAFFHSNLASMYYKGEINPLAVIGFGSLYLLAFVQLFFKKWQHFAIMFVAWAISFAIISLAYPQTLKDFNDSLASSSSSSSSLIGSSSSSVLSSTSSAQSSSLSVATNSVSSIANSSVQSVSSSAQNVAISSQSQVKTVSKSQLAGNNSSSNCWISFDKKVYNVTNYLGKHPGGRRELLNVCGQEIDNLSSGHQGGSFDSTKIQGILGQFYVGDLV